MTLETLQKISISNLYDHNVKSQSSTLSIHITIRHYRVSGLRRFRFGRSSPLNKTNEYDSATLWRARYTCACSTSGTFLEYTAVFTEVVGRRVGTVRGKKVHRSVYSIACRTCTGTSWKEATRTMENYRTSCPESANTLKCCNSVRERKD